MKELNFIHKATKVVGNEKIVVKINLGGFLSNGYEEFSITCSGYERKTEDSWWQESFVGAAHDTILRFFPEFKVFVDLHLRDLKGVPMYCVPNGFYFLQNGFNNTPIDSENFPAKYCSYLDIEMGEFEALNKSCNKLEFAAILISLGVTKRWLKKAQKGVKFLEELKGEKFTPYFETIKNNLGVTQNDLKEYDKLKSEGYFLPEHVSKRKKEAIQKQLEKSHEIIREENQKAIDKANREYNIKKEWLRLGFDIANSGNMKGAIYYTHSNTLGLNWSTEKLSKTEINFLLENIDRSKFEGLKIEENKTTLETI